MPADVLEAEQTVELVVDLDAVPLCQIVQPHAYVECMVTATSVFSCCLPTVLVCDAFVRVVERIRQDPRHRCGACKRSIAECWRTTPV